MDKKIDIVSVRLQLNGSLERREKISSPKEIAKIIKDFLEESDRESMVLACLDVKNQINNLSIISTGSLNSSIVHPREVFKAAILSNSASIIVAHNHPSGDIEPSKEDKNVTNRLQEAGKILGIELLDHIILGYDDKYFSFKENWLI